MSTEALKMALEALDHNLLFTSLMPGYDGRVIEKAYKAINKVLAEQPAQQQETINGRTVKVDWKAQALELRELVRLGGIKIAELEAELAEQPAQQEIVACPTCGEYEPRTGTCGASPNDKRALCNRRDQSPPAQPQQEPVPTECRRDGRCQYAIDNGIEGLSLGFPQPAQQQEPVAWVCYGAPGKRDIDFEETDINGLPVGTLLYTSPPAQRKPLTDEELEEIVKRGAENKPFHHWFARAIEAAHGIKETT